MNKTIYVDWGGHNIKLTWLPSFFITDSQKVTSVHGYCFHEGKILLSYIKDRGYNFPGGHVEKGETPEQAFIREALEEGYVTGEICYLGAIEVSHEENPHFDPDGKYPVIGYQAFYRMDVTECRPFLREYEASTRIWVEPKEIPYVMDDHELALSVLKEALKKTDPLKSATVAKKSF
ncbi:NUDIX hydrolase [Pseudalkalibacillus caeni]|uniref:NUDIX domain-containing protein n=1 Tax=Exobacillus caeni TaxID=2574798 RepID=A0A5R9EY61_9BACL|nr:NUDIX domain-containing protein [Pseudalkalibacillus caeni]TLS36047.1 NUDIX domain-containing protein [Pseudalkalibacillus caeni]